MFSGLYAYKRMALLVYNDTDILSSTNEQCTCDGTSSTRAIAPLLIELLLPPLWWLIALCLNSAASGVSSSSAVLLPACICWAASCWVWNPDLSC